MSIFEDKLNSATIHEEIEVKILFESFLLKRTDSPYNFINLSSDLEEVVEYKKEDPRYIVKSKDYDEVKKFLKFPVSKIFGKIHYICAKMSSDKKDNLDLVVFGHDEYEILKKFVQLFIAKYPDVSVQLKLDTPKIEYVYPEIETKGFWQILKELFINTNILIDEQPITHL